MKPHPHLVPLPPLGPGKSFFGRFLLRPSRINRRQVVSLVKFIFKWFCCISTFFWETLYSNNCQAAMGSAALTSCWQLWQTYQVKPTSLSNKAYHTEPIKQSLPKQTYRPNQSYQSMFSQPNQTYCKPTKPKLGKLIFDFNHFKHTWKPIELIPRSHVPLAMC